MKVCMPSWPLIARIKLLPLSQTCAPGVVWLNMLGGVGSKHEVNLGFRVKVGRVCVFARWALRTLSPVNSGLALNSLNALCPVSSWRPLDPLDSLGPGFALDSLGACRTGLALSACGTNGTRWASGALWPAAG